MPSRSSWLRRPCIALSRWVVGLALAWASDARAEAENPALVEARQRFDRGLELYEKDDYLGALAEFERAHELTSHPVVLYNVALVHAKLGNAVQAVEAIEALRVRGWSELGVERQARLERAHAEQSARIGTLALSVNVPDAVLQVDNVDVPRASMERLRLGVGRHLVSAFAPNHAPKSWAVSVVGGAHRSIAIELVPLEATLGRVKLSSNVSDVEVRLAGELVAELPLAGELVLKPGSHRFEFTRTGYNRELRRIELAPGGDVALDVTMTPTREGLRTGGQLILAISEPNAVVEVDRVPQANPDAGIPLPRGVHDIKVRRAGFFDVERRVNLADGTRRALEVKLLPTPEYWADYVARARRTRTVAYVLGGAGALALAASGGYLLWNRGEKREAERAFDAHADAVEAMGPGSCDMTCRETSNILLDDLESKRKRDVYGWVGLGIGAGALGAGVLLYALGDDPTRYDPGRESDVFGGISLNFGVATLAVSGNF